MPSNSLAGQFAVILDEFGNEKVVMFSNSNHFVFDSIKDKLTTPLLLKKLHQPKILGSLVSFVKNYALEDCLKDLDQYLKDKLPDKNNDALLIVRALYWLFSKNLHIHPSPKIIQESIDNALVQENQTMIIHSFIKEVERLSK